MECDRAVPVRASTGRDVRPAIRGVGLLEIVVATLILGVITLGFGQFLARGRYWFDQEERKRVATLLAQEALERTSALPYAQIGPWTERRVIASIPYAINVTTQSNVPETEMQTVRCIVTWPATPLTQRSVSLATLAYDQ
jgi:Tfp pilus assembly protein PilV